LAQVLKIYHQVTNIFKQLNLTKMKKHLLFVALLFAFNIGKIFAQQHHQQHYQNNHHDGHQNGHHSSENSSGFGYPDDECNLQLSVLKINVENPYRTQIIIDGKSYGTVQNNYTGIELAAGKHFIQLYRTGHRTGGYMVFSGDIWMKVNSLATATLTRFDGLVMNQVPILTNTCSNTNYSTCTFAVDDRTFCTFKNVVKNAWFDSDKQQLIGHFLSRNYVSSNQVEQLLGMIDFESTRLKVAKEAYTKVVDKNNFYTVFNQFDFESSKRELSNFMATC
jgi:hypothetical protein